LPQSFEHTGPSRTHRLRLEGPTGGCSPGAFDRFVA
jgi:hypothetical protein